MVNRHITVEAVSPTIGGEVGNIDLSQPLSKQVVEELRQALLAHKVLFFRDQDITPEQQLTFARHFGKLESYPPAPVLYEGQPEHPELLLLVADRYHLPAADHWHSDQTWAREPAMGSILRAIKVPSAGGDTIFADMYAAYDGLGAEMQSFISGLRAVNEFTKLYGHACEGLLKMDPDEMKEMLVRRPPVIQPVVRTHPETGRKALYVNHFFTKRILGLPEAASRELLDFLRRPAEIRNTNADSDGARIRLPSGTIVPRSIMRLRIIIPKQGSCTGSRSAMIPAVLVDGCQDSGLCKAKRKWISAA